MTSLANKNHPKYEPNKWNTKYIRKTHNCYSYALNIIDKSRGEACKKYEKKTGLSECYKLHTHPGQYAGYIDEFTGEKLNKTKLLRRIMRDNPNIIKLTKKQECPDNYYKIAVIVSKCGTDYHFFRQDNNGLWSHKNGCDNATNKDDKGQLITDPEKAHLSNSESIIFCGYLAVPNSRKNKNISNITRTSRGTISGAQYIYDTVR
jgi:hypothetical protein